MKVNSNNFQYNTGLSTNILNNYVNGCTRLGNISSVKDSFQKNVYVTSPQRQTSAASLYSSYNPKQLLNAYSNVDYVNSLSQANPNVKALLDSKGIEYNVYPENITNISSSHLSTTTAYALQIANKLNLSASDKQILEQACVFHDFGKILIPKEILNKPGELNAEEKEIMNLHSQLGYELLSSTGINKRVLELVKNHHKPLSENNDVLGQILSVADIYSALREQRSYKNSLSQNEAIAILDQKAINGEVSTEVVNALKASLTSCYAA